MVNPLTAEVAVWKVALAVVVLCTVAFYLLHRRQGDIFPTATSEPTLGVDKVVTQLKSELEQMEVQRELNGTLPLFSLRDFDIELGFVIKQDSSVKGKLEYEVVTAEMEQKLGQERTHKITLHMKLAPPAELRGLSATPELSSEGAKPLP